MTVPRHQIRAVFTADTITVYQAYQPEIATAALALLPVERPYPLPAGVARVIDAGSE